MTRAGQRRVAAVVALALVGLVAVVAGLTGWRERLPLRSAPSSFVLGAENLTFSTDTITVEAGTIEITLANTDAIAHTFTVPELGIEVEAGGGEARSVVFEGEPGRYAFECTIPGHDTPGMRGTLRIVA